MPLFFIRLVTAGFLTAGVILVTMSGLPYFGADLLSGQGSTILIEPSPLHGAAPDQQTATQQLILGLLLILLGLGIYTFWFIRNRDFPRSPKHTKRTTLIRTSSRWFWIG